MTPGVALALNLAPDLLGDLDQPAELDPLIGFLEVVAVRGR